MVNVQSARSTVENITPLILWKVMMNLMDSQMQGKPEDIDLHVQRFLGWSRPVIGSITRDDDDDVQRFCVGLVYF